MIKKDFLEKYANKNQTNFLNVAREYFQHFFLSTFYKQKGCENFLFKGGTALKLVFGSPRFSEDLDFSGVKNGVIYENILAEVLNDLEKEGFKLELEESKKTSGGFLSILKVDLFGLNFEIFQEISFRPEKFLSKELALVSSELIPSYRVYLLAREKLVEEKLTALLTRQKPRDFFDLYYFFRNQELHRFLKLDSEKRKKILDFLEKQDKKKINHELKSLLPKSFWLLIKDLPSALKGELQRL